jgi:hypothetical protein
MASVTCPACGQTFRADGEPVIRAMITSSGHDPEWITTAADRVVHRCTDSEVRTHYRPIPRTT